VGIRIWRALPYSGTERPPLLDSRRIRLVPEGGPGGMGPRVSSKMGLEMFSVKVEPAPRIEHTFGK
jgi:hypothetical protein